MRLSVFAPVVVLALTAIGCGGGGGGDDRGSGPDGDGAAGPRACLSAFAASAQRRTAQRPSALPAYVDRLIEAKRDPSGASAADIQRRAVREGVADDRTVDAFYDQLSAEALAEARPWARSREGRALAWFAPSAPAVNGLAGLRDGFAVAETVGPRSAALTVLDRDGATRWRRALPRGRITEKSGPRDLLRVHGARGRVLVVSAADEAPGEQEFRGTLRLASFDETTGGPGGCVARSLSYRGLPSSVTYARNSAPFLNTAVDPGMGALVLATPGRTGTRIELFDGRTLRRRWAHQVDGLLTDVGVGEGVVVAARDPNTIDDDAKASDRTQLVTLDARSGAERWRVTGPPPTVARPLATKGLHLTAPRFADGLVLAAAAPAGEELDATPTTQVVAWDARTGRERWTSRPAGVPDEFPGLGVVGRRVITGSTGFEGERLSVLDLRTGRTLGTTDLDVDLDDPPAPIGSPPRAALVTAVSPIIAPLDGRSARTMRLAGWYGGSIVASSGNRILMADLSSRTLLALRSDRLASSASR